MRDQIQVMNHLARCAMGGVVEEIGAFSVTAIDILTVALLNGHTLGKQIFRSKSMVSILSQYYCMTRN